MTLNQPTSLNCPACGAPLDADGTSTVVRCKFCGNTSMLPGAQSVHAAGPAGAMDEIRRLAGGGNLAAAIERYRQAYGVDEQEARDVVEALQGRTAGNRRRAGNARSGGINQGAGGCAAPAQSRG